MTVNSAPARDLNLVCLFVLSWLIVPISPAAAALTLIPGTRISLEVPERFEVASDFTGILWRDAGTSVLAAEVPTSAAHMQAGLTKEALAGRGLALIRRETVSAGIGRAVLLEATQSAQGIEVQKWILVGGDADNTVMITGSVPASLGAQLGPRIREILLTATWDPTRDPGKAAAFAFDFVETADLKIARNLGGAIVMTQGGSRETASPLGPALVISRTTSATAVDDLAAFAKRRLDQTRTISGTEIREQSTFDLAGMPVHELVAAGTAKNGGAVIVYQLVGYDGVNLVFVQAFSEPGLEARYLPQFREIARSLRPR